VVIYLALPEAVGPPDSRGRDDISIGVKQPTRGRAGRP